MKDVIALTSEKFFTLHVRLIYQHKKSFYIKDMEFPLCMHIAQYQYITAHMTQQWI